MKFLPWIVIGFAVVMWIRHSHQMRKSSSTSRLSAEEEIVPTHRDGVERVVRCGHCGLHVPVSEAVIGASGATFCSAEHRALRRSS